MSNDKQQTNENAQALGGQVERCVMRLRQYNAWRRGSDEIEQPDPKELGELIDLAASLLEKLSKKETIINPVPNPRYDKVFRDGLEMLNDA